MTENTDVARAVCLSDDISGALEWNSEIEGMLENMRKSGAELYIGESQFPVSDLQV